MDTPANEAALLNRCRIVENTTRNLSEKYSGRVDERLQSELTRLVNRAREYEHGTFIILVVGPAKSGKSTLVNLIAHDFVSPTGFLECTVRPSVISRRTDGEDSSLTVYSGTDSDMRLEQIDSIIDIIRGFGNDDELQGVISEKLPLTEDNIRRHVQLGLEKSLDSENLLSSIRTEGGNLLQDRVFVIDMPGFDGAYQNIDNPVYETIARRADLIIFVQSSNAAFSKVSKEFLNVLSANNRSVPVCLVHNVFDAAWWRDPAKKLRDVEKQRDFAENEIRRMGFNIDSAHCFCINLGAVDDFRHGMTDADGKLRAAAAQYDDMERLMYERIISKRDSMRLNNTLARVGQQRDHILASVSKALAKLNTSLERYETERLRLEQLRPTAATLDAAIPSPDLGAVLDCVRNECLTASNGINLDIKKSNGETIEILNNTLAAINRSLGLAKDSIFGISAISRQLYLVYRTALGNLEVELASLPGGFRAKPCEERAPENVGDFDVALHINIENIVPRKTIFQKLGKHTGEEINKYIGIVMNLLVPAPDGTRTDMGLLAVADVARIRADVRNAVDALLVYYRASLMEYFDAVSASVLRSILPDPEGARNEINVLTGLGADLRNMTV